MAKIEARLSALGLVLPPPTRPPPGVRLPFNIPVEIEGEVEFSA